MNRIILRGAGIVERRDARDATRRINVRASDIHVYDSGIVIYCCGNSWHAGRLGEIHCEINDLEFVDATMVVPEDATACDKCHGDPTNLPLRRCPKCGMRA